MVAVAATPGRVRLRVELSAWVEGVTTPTVTAELGDNVVSRWAGTGYVRGHASGKAWVVVSSSWSCCIIPAAHISMARPLQSETTEVSRDWNSAARAAI